MNKNHDIGPIWPGIRMVLGKETIIEEECNPMALLYTNLGNFNPEGYQGKFQYLFTLCKVM